MYWNLKRNVIFQKEWDKFKDDYSTEGYSLEYVFEIYLPFWECKQNIVVEKELEPDRFSKILLELINNGKRSHAEICQFLGIEETNFCTMQIHFLIKNNLIEQNGSEYEITHEGLAFLENREKPKAMEIEEFEYMAKEKFNFLENDMTNDFFDPRKPIDKQLSVRKKSDFSGYKILQTHKIEKEQGKIFIKHNNNPTYRKVVEKRNDFSDFFNAMKPDKIFYDFADSELESYKRSICFLGFWYENREKPDDRKIDIMQFEKTVEKFDGYELERELSKKITEYVLKNDVRVGDNTEIEIKISEGEPQKETLPPSTLNVPVQKQSLSKEPQQQQSQQSVQIEPKKTSMSNELITIRAWIEKHSFDQSDSFTFLVGKTLDGVTVKSVNTKVSESALDSYINDVRTAQKRKPLNKGVKKAETESTLTVLKKLEVASAKTTAAKPKEPVEPKPEKKQSAAPAPTAPPQQVPPAQNAPAPKQSPPEEPPQQQQSQPSPQPVQSEPKKVAGFTADVSKVIDPVAVLARIQKSKQEKATMRDQRNIMSNEFKFCSECGKKLKIKAKYCTQCGAKQEE